MGQTYKAWQQAEEDSRMIRVGPQGPMSPGLLGPGQQLPSQCCQPALNPGCQASVHLPQQPLPFLPVVGPQALPLLSLPEGEEGLTLPADPPDLLLCCLQPNSCQTVATAHPCGYPYIELLVCMPAVN